MEATGTSRSVLYEPRRHYHPVRAVLYHRRPIAPKPHRKTRPEPEEARERHDYRKARKTRLPATSSSHGTPGRASAASPAKAVSRAKMLQLLRNGSHVQGLSPTSDRTYEADPRRQDSSGLW